MKFYLRISEYQINFFDITGECHFFRTVDNNCVRREYVECRHALKREHEKCSETTMAFVIEFFLPS